MLNYFKTFILTIIFFIIAKASLFAYQDYENKLAYKIHKNVLIEVISPVKSINKEEELYFGLLFRLKPGWKIYWKNPGKAGYPPKINWSKSKNIKELEILWPKPKKFEILGMKSIGYEGEIVLPLRLKLQRPNEKLFINFDVDYLTCKEICVPLNDNLILNIPAGNGQSSEYAKLIAEYVDKVNYSSYSNIFNTNSILFFIIIAFIGGAILNLMPCVFPVLSLKIYNVLSQLKNTSNKNIKKNLFATVFGIIFSFFLLAFFTVILKSFGHTLGWGFQFQSPFFLIFLIIILILFSLNLVGLFSIDIPAFLKMYLNKFINLNKNKSELFQNFLLGFFVTILSTPCSAPFLGTALGFAFVSPNQIIFLIFFSVSLGLASPYIILATYPKTLSFLPKPGLWMKKLKYFLSFLLILTALWLISVLSTQIDNRINSNNNLKEDWLTFKVNEINKLVNIEKKIVFVDITAEWCITCFFNKKTVIDRKKVKQIFKEYNIQKMRGDLTKPNNEINEYINSFGRFGIPVNVVYSPSAPQGVLLPEILTVKVLLSTLKNVKND